jgi:hypothetical protein
LQRDETSLLDIVRDQAKSLRGTASRADQARLDEYFDSVRAVELRLESSLRPQKRWINEGKLPMDRPNPGIPGTHAEHVRLMLDILILALWTDSTRVATFMLGDAQSAVDYSFLPGVKGSFHGLSHHRDIPENRAQYEKIVTWNVEQLAWFLEKMRSLKEGRRHFAGPLDDFVRRVVEGRQQAYGGEIFRCCRRAAANGAIRPGRRLRAEPLYRRSAICTWP